MKIPVLPCQMPPAPPVPPDPKPLLNNLREDMNNTVEALVQSLDRLEEALIESWRSVGHNYFIGKWRAKYDPIEHTLTLTRFNQENLVSLKVSLKH